MTARLSRALPFFLVLALPWLVLTGCSGRSAESAGSEKSGSQGNPPTSLYLQLVEGLHVTGTPVEVDVETFRLRVEGAVEKPLSLSFEQVRALPAVRENITLNCPGFFTDRGTWTGVPVRDLLAMAGVRAEAARVFFTSLSEDYSSSLSLKDIERDGVLVAYEFDGKPFPVVHGFPLRLTARDHEGNVWVKWLEEIRVSE